MTSSSTSTSIPTLETLLAASAATPEFRDAASALVASGKSSDRIRFGAGSPPVKVQRVLCQLLETYPAEAIDSVEVEARSGCSDYRGVIHVSSQTRSFDVEFIWDCAWKASQVGLKTFWGDPDQQKAAREFGFRCFQHFAER